MNSLNYLKTAALKLCAMLCMLSFSTGVAAIPTPMQIKDWWLRQSKVLDAVQLLQTPQWFWYRWQLPSNQVEAMLRRFSQEVPAPHRVRFGSQHLEWSTPLRDSHCLLSIQPVVSQQRVQVDMQCMPWQATAKSVLYQPDSVPFATTKAQLRWSWFDQVNRQSVGHYIFQFPKRYSNVEEQIHALFHQPKTIAKTMQYQLVKQQEHVFMVMRLSAASVYVVQHSAQLRMEGK